MTQKRISQFEAILALCAALAGEGATRKQIADALGLKKSPNLYSLINHLVEEKYLIARVDESQYPPRYKYLVPIEG